MGGECCMWTEFAPQRRVENMLFPRILATAENLWTAPQEKNPKVFYRRVVEHCRHLRAMGVDVGAAYPAGGEPA
jgi:hexosaminidase